jgi:hypothetical protein
LELANDIGEWRTPRVVPDDYALTVHNSHNINGEAGEKVLLMYGRGYGATLISKTLAIAAYFTKK